MIKRECQQVGTLTKCQIPFDENGISGITQFVSFVVLICFGVHIGIRILGRIFK